MKLAEKILLILDIDEVLIYSTDDASELNYDFLISSYRVLKRPYVDEFIDTVFKLFDIAIWTHATEDYAQGVVKNLIPDSIGLKFLWSRKRCTQRYDIETGEYYWLKNLKKVKRQGYRLEKVLVIEDDHRSMEQSYGNLIKVKAFKGDLFDEELYNLIFYLKWISTVENVREINKLNWHNFLKD